MSPLPQNSCFPDASQSPSRAPSPEDSFVTSKDKDTSMQRDVTSNGPTDTSMQRDVTSNGPTDTSMQRDVTSNGPAPVLQVGTYICIDVCVYIHVCEVRMDLCMYWCMCMHTCVRSTYGSMYVCTHVYTYMCLKHVCTPPHIMHLSSLFMYVCMHACMYIIYECETTNFHE
jgi:hypothetical protein